MDLTGARLCVERYVAGTARDQATPVPGAYPVSLPMVAPQHVDDRAVDDDGFPNRRVEDLAHAAILLGVLADTESLKDIGGLFGGDAVAMHPGSDLDASSSRGRRPCTSRIPHTTPTP